MTATRMFVIALLIVLTSIGACSKGSRLSPSSPDLPGGQSDFLEGYITDSSDKPLVDISVFISDLDGNPLGQTTTDKDGHFRFDLDPGKDYLITTRESSSGNAGPSWQYIASPMDDVSACPGSEDYSVDPTTGLKIWIPGGSVQGLDSPPDNDRIDIGADKPIVYTIRGANSMVKIRPDTVLAALDPFIAIEGARGEHESFQLVPMLYENVDTIHDVEVTASDLTKGSDRISQDHVTIYKENYVEVTKASDNGGATGWWPDALVPITRTFDVTSDFPSPVWIDVDIPRDAVPGLYSGYITFSTSDHGTSLFQYTLEIWDLTFPRRLYMKANIGLDQEDIAAAHSLPSGLTTPEGRVMAKKYAQFLAERHIATHGLPVMNPRVILNPDGRSYAIDFTQMDSEMSEIVDAYDLNNFNFPLDMFDAFGNGLIAQGDPLFSDDYNARFKDYVQKVSTHLATRGYLDMSYMFIVDEPSSAESYQQVRDFYTLLHQATIGPSYMVTEQPAPQNPAWGSLHDYSDIFTSSVRALWSMGGEEFARAGGEDKEEWLYTNTNVYPFTSLSVDKQGIEPRLFVWFAYQHEFRGIFYFSASSWTDSDPWVDPLTWGTGFGNGCGSLIYPGSGCSTNAGQDNVEGPVTSIRLELLRDGLEDSQLLYMAGNGLPVAATEQIMTDWFNYTHDPKELLRVRGEIADLLSGSM